MNAVEVAVRFTVAWLAVGLGLFIALGSLRALHPVGVARAGAGRRASWHPLYVVPFLAALGVLAVGFLEAMRAVPW